MSSFGSHIKIDRYRRSHLKICTSIGFDIGITKDTKINIFFDNSGSMPNTLPPLQDMADNELKDVLLPFYDGNETAYNNNVNVQTDGSERTFQVLNSGDPTQHNVVNIFFQDEAGLTYHTNDNTFLSTDPRDSTYDTDISNLRSNLNSWPDNSFLGIIFAVRSGSRASSSFDKFLRAVENGDGNYSPPWGLSNYEDVRFNYCINAGDAPEYYAEKILHALGGNDVSDCD